MNPEIYSLNKLQSPSILSNFTPQNTPSYNFKPGTLSWNSEGYSGKLSSITLRAHHPSYYSGVTIGRGYDMKEKKFEDIKKDFISIGLDSQSASRLAKGSQLTREDASNFIQEPSLPSITPEQERKLFEISYKSASEDIKRIIKKPDLVKKYGSSNWENLNPIIKEVLIDLRFRGDYHTRSRIYLQKHITNNDAEKFKSIMNNKQIWVSLFGVPESRFEKRVNFIKQNLL